MSARIQAQTGMPPDALPVGSVSGAAATAVDVVVGVGLADAAWVGVCVGAFVGAVVGVAVGARVGAGVGVLVGAGVGVLVAVAVGCGSAVADATADAPDDGCASADVPAVGAAGDSSGLRVGAASRLALAWGTSEASSPEHAARPVDRAIRHRIRALAPHRDDRFRD
jgi:hypothetical protein